MIDDSIPTSTSQVPPTENKRPFLNSDLDTAGKDIFGFMRKHYPVAFPMFIIACILFVGAFFTMMTGASFLPVSPSSPIAIRVVVAIMLYVSVMASGIYALGFYIIARMSISKDFAKRFAAVMGYAFSDSAPFSSVSGDIFTFGFGSYHQIYDVVSGTYRNHPVRIFEYQFSGAGENEPMHYYTVLELQFAHPLPKIRMVKTATDLEDMATLSRAIDVHPSCPMKISLESDFDEYFSIYVPPNTQTEGLAIMTPDLMALLIDHYDEYRNIGLECHDEKLYLHALGRFSDKKIKDFAALYSLADALIPKLDEAG
jgi:hypothetical protein